MDEATAEERFRTDFVERNRVKLEAIYQLGRESFRTREAEIRMLFEESA